MSKFNILVFTLVLYMHIFDGVDTGIDIDYSMELISLTWPRY